MLKYIKAVLPKSVALVASFVVVWKTMSGDCTVTQGVGSLLAITGMFILASLLFRE